MGWRKDKLGRWRYSFRCDACDRSFKKVPSAPMLRNEVWNKIANPAETLCASCLSERMVRMFGRTLRFADLLPCYFNMMHSPHSWFDLFMSAAKRAPANIAEWRAVAQREKYEQAMVEKLGRGIFSAASPAGW